MNPQVLVGVIAFSAVILGAGITLIGNYLLQHSTHSWQREQWLLDKKTAEYKELLSTLAWSVESMAQNSLDFGENLSSVTGEHHRLAYETAASEARRTINDRIFVTKQVEAAAVLDLWQGLAGERDMLSFWNKWRWIRQRIIETARDDLDIKSR